MTVMTGGAGFLCGFPLMWIMVAVSAAVAFSLTGFLVFSLLRDRNYDLVHDCFEYEDDVTPEAIEILRQKAAKAFSDVRWTPSEPTPPPVKE